MTKDPQPSLDAIRNQVYNLLLAPGISEAERQLLLAFKEQVEVPKADPDQALLALQRGIQQLAVKHISDHQPLSPEVAQLSQNLRQLQTKAERDANIARGLSSLGFLGR